MVHPLYWVTALTYALVMVIILIHDLQLNKETDKLNKAFRALFNWVIFFCLQDVAWGLCGGEAVKSDKAFFISSTVFHLSTVSTTFVWLNYVLTYLGDKIKHHTRYLVIDAFVVLFQVTLLVINFFTPTIFYIEDGRYITAFLRPIAFFNQYVVYLLIGIISLLSFFTASEESKQKFFTVFVFSFAPILSGVFQLMYPDGPFYSMGYFLGCFIIHMFIVSKDRDEIIQLQHELQIAEQIAISNTDGLTGLKNRRAYNEEMKNLMKGAPAENFVYFSIDINGLKAVNDNIGHQAGDELIIGAAQCLNQVFSAYGSLFRIGGDEFAALVFVSNTEIEEIEKNIKTTELKWTEQNEEELSVSWGYACYCDMPGVSVTELAKEADKKMYKAKSDYYRQKGFDRRGQQVEFNALCTSYAKILKINLSDDSYKVIHMEKSEQSKSKGFSEKISEWLHDFGVSGQVHSDDLETYLEKTNIQYMRNYFTEKQQPLNVFYRRLTDGEFRNMKMEIIPAEDFSEKKQSLYLYVKDIDS